MCTNKKMKRKKGFTLIELLAIIVILAIIAVITVPIILNVIDESKKGVAKDSAYGYKDAVNKYYLERLIDNVDFKLEDNYYFVNEDGNIVSSNYGFMYDINVSGTNPKGGFFEYENNKITDGCLTIDDYKVNIENGEVTTVEKGSCPDMSPTSCSIESSPESWFKFEDKNNPGKITNLQLKDADHPDGYNGEDIMKIPCYRSDGTKVTTIGWGGFQGLELKELIFSDTFETIQDGPLTGVTIDKIIFGKSIKALSGSTLGFSKLGKVIFLGTPEYVRDGTFSGSTIDELILGNSVNAFFAHVFKGIKSIKTIYNNENKVLDWNQLLTGNSYEPFNYGVVKKNDIDIVIKSDDNNLKKVDKQIVNVVDNVVTFQ